MNDLSEFDGFDDSETDAECPNCNGMGFVHDCFEEFACIDPEGGCELCRQRCDWCDGKG